MGLRGTRLARDLPFIVVGVVPGAITEQAIAWADRVSRHGAVARLVIVQ